jgi:hypothetical protein
MFDYRISKHPHFNEACRTFASTSVESSVRSVSNQISGAVSWCGCSGLSLLRRVVAREKMPQYVLKATAEIGRVAASAVSGVQLNAATRRQVVPKNHQPALSLR